MLIRMRSGSAPFWTEGFAGLSIWWWYESFLSGDIRYQWYSLYQRYCDLYAVCFSSVRRCAATVDRYSTVTDEAQYLQGTLQGTTVPYDFGDSASVPCTAPGDLG